MSLKSRLKFGFVDGSIKKPTDVAFLENWEVVHCTLVQWIRNTIDSSLLDTISYVEDASVLWSELETQFAVVDGTKIHGLKTQLHNCKQAKGMDVTTYYGKRKALWDSIVVHELPFACKYGKCECQIGPAAVKRLDNERLHQFFMGLDDTLYANIRSQQFQLDPLPTLNRAYHAVLQEERLRAPVESALDVSGVVAYVTPASSPSLVDWRALRDKERGERRHFFCSYCDTRVHDVSNCYIKSQKFPEWWGDRPRSLTDLRHARAASRGSSGTGQSFSSSVPAGRGSASSVPPVQAHMVHSPVSTNSAIASDRLSGMCSWIFDTGASNHVTGDSSCLLDQLVIHPRTVGLPNGQQVESTIMGSVYINASLSLHRVLYVASLTCNLISVSQLTSDRDYVFEFAKRSCFIQDRSLRTTIGVGELRDGLYWICAEARSLVVH
ncbi:hypothetical protein RND81_08G152600 [Saponaria officinalis]|uniref:Retrovirus-related Pol polyprotein from transposon TNT 1-94-like beta-barrel domain-containing protein n=1 Tax=Saponaria officinalis TaxID=3572 RepID=A0AAW1J8K1_SAPOF